MTHTPEQKRGIRRTVFQLVVIMTTVIVLFLWKLDRQKVVKPDALPAGLVMFEAPAIVPYWPVTGLWSIGLIDRADCAGDQCNPARPILKRLWESDARFPLDRLAPLWFAPFERTDEVFNVQAVGREWPGNEDINWFNDGWESYSHTLVIVNPEGAMVGLIRPPYSPEQLLRAMAASGVR